MERRIHLQDTHYTVTVAGHSRERRLKVDDGEFQPAVLDGMANGQGTIRLGGSSARVALAVKGDTVHIRAFGQTFALDIVNPVEQAAQESGGTGNSARAPMPGTVIAVDVTAGSLVARGQPMMTIESMKILTVITAPRDGEVARVNFEPGATFDKNAALITLSKQKED